MYCVSRRVYTLKKKNYINKFSCNLLNVNLKKMLKEVIINHSELLLLRCSLNVGTGSSLWKKLPFLSHVQL